MKIAASMSKTAGLGRTESVSARPTPVPPPTFALLQPSWLPEPMTVRVEQRQVSTPDGPVSTTNLYFDTESGSDPHNALTLIEQPKGRAADGSHDASATHETIGGRDVTIGRRGEACMNVQWVQGDVALTLINSYDPPGHARYACDAVRKVVESVR